MTSDQPSSPDKLSSKDSSNIFILGPDEKPIQREKQLRVRFVEALLRIRSVLQTRWVQIFGYFISVVAMALVVWLTQVIHHSRSSLVEEIEKTDRLEKRVADLRGKLVDLKGDNLLLHNELDILQDRLQKSSKFFKRLLTSMNKEELEIIRSIWEELKAPNLMLAGNPPELVLARDDINVKDVQTLSKIVQEQLEILPEVLFLAIERGELMVVSSASLGGRSSLENQTRLCKIFVAGKLTNSSAASLASEIDKVGATFGRESSVTATYDYFPKTKGYSVILAIRKRGKIQNLFEPTIANRILQLVNRESHLGPKLSRNNPYKVCFSARRRSHYSGVRG